MPAKMAGVHKSSLFQGGGGRGVKRSSPAEGSTTNNAAAMSEEEKAQAERENEAILSALQGDAQRLRRSAEGLRDESRDHLRIADSVSEGFGRATGGIRVTINKLDGVMKRYGCKHTVVLACALALLVFIAYYLIRWTSSQRKATPSP